jgi:hypothetical protein
MCCVIMDIFCRMANASNCSRVTPISDADMRCRLPHGRLGIAL